MDILKFLKNWTLPVSMATGAMAYLLFAFTPALDAASTFLQPIFEAILPLFMFLILYVTFCKVDFRKLQPVKWHLWVGIFQVIFVAIVVGAILVFHIAGKGLILLEAILTCIIGPCAAAAAVVTQKLGGSLEDMTTYTFLSNFICAALIPICFPLIEPGANMGFVASFLLILYKVCMVLVVPMILAYITKHLGILHKLHQWIVSVKDLSFYLWGCSLMIVTGTTVKNIVHADSTVAFLLLIALLSLILCMIQFAVGRYIGHFFHSTVESGQGLGQKNTAFAIWIAYTYLNPLSSVGPGCYILWQNIINSIEIWHHERHTKELNATAKGYAES
ncbi:transporter [Prevotella sp. HUN102]|uniref:transporter n=1 Tax=Prevotella sp. HUN102 TaxID=1392486 RepID=UPI00048DBE38|nr:transporter [Prevotella sp. HUN102]